MGIIEFDVVYNKRNEKWLVRADGNLLAWKDEDAPLDRGEPLAYDVKDEAVEVARQAARENTPSKLVIKNKVGGVSESHTYE